MIDLAISMTLLGGAPASGAIIFGKDIKTGLPPILDYGVPGRGIEDQAKFVMEELIEEEYYSRFMKGLWVVPDRTEEEVAVTAIAAGKARFEFGEKPDV